MTQCFLYDVLVFWSAGLQVRKGFWFNLNNIRRQRDMKFRPLHDRVLLRRIEQENKTAGGIIIPDTAQEKPVEGEVLACGNGLRDETGNVVSLDVKAGDRVLFTKWAGSEVTIDGEELLVMKESDIVGIVEAA
jgi:chaperonin GroES